jgi:bisphosphoglycerate-independent phosphoglycerate mutase (AlkP superfamily)
MLPHETPEQNLQATSMDLVFKKLFESGIPQLELQIHTLESGLVIARGRVLEMKLLDDPVTKKEFEDQIVKDTELLGEAKQQLVDRYLAIVPTLDKGLLQAMREHVIRGVNRLEPKEKEIILGKIREQK